MKLLILKEKAASGEEDSKPRLVPTAEMGMWIPCTAGER